MLWKRYSEYTGWNFAAFLDSLYTYVLILCVYSMSMYCWGVVSHILCLYATLSKFSKRKPLHLVPRGAVILDNWTRGLLFRSMDIFSAKLKQTEIQWSVMYNNPWQLGLLYSWRQVHRKQLLYLSSLYTSLLWLKHTRMTRHCKIMSQKFVSTCCLMSDLLQGANLAVFMLVWRVNSWNMIFASWPTLSLGDMVWWHVQAQTTSILRVSNDYTIKITRSYWRNEIAEQDLLEYLGCEKYYFNRILV